MTEVTLDPTLLAEEVDSLETENRDLRRHYEVLVATAISVTTTAVLAASQKCPPYDQYAAVAMFQLMVELDSAVRRLGFLPQDGEEIFSFVKMNEIARSLAKRNNVGLKEF